jgi:hypothetical protein
MLTGPRNGLVAFKGGEITLLVELEERIDGAGMFRDPDSFLNTIGGVHECVGRNGLRAVSIEAAAVAKVGPSHAVGFDTVTIITPVSWANRVCANSSRVTAIAASPRLAEGVGALQRVVGDGEPHVGREIAAATVFLQTEAANGDPRAGLSAGPGAEVYALDERSDRGHNDGGENVFEKHEQVVCDEESETKECRTIIV